MHHSFAPWGGAPTKPITRSRHGVALPQNIHAPINCRSATPWRDGSCRIPGRARAHRQQSIERVFAVRQQIGSMPAKPAARVPERLDKIQVPCRGCGNRGHTCHMQRKERGAGGEQVRRRRSGAGFVPARVAGAGLQRRTGCRIGGRGDPLLQQNGRGRGRSGGAGHSRRIGVAAVRGAQRPDARQQRVRLRQRQARLLVG